QDEPQGSAGLSQPAPRSAGLPSRPRAAAARAPRHLLNAASGARQATTDAPRARCSRSLETIVVPYRRAIATYSASAPRRRCAAARLAACRASTVVSAITETYGSAAIDSAYAWAPSESLVARATAEATSTRSSVGTMTGSD